MPGTALWVVLPMSYNSMGVVIVITEKKEYKQVYKFLLLYYITTIFIKTDYFVYVWRFKEYLKKQD
jgi:hypothetical protein